MVNIKKNVVVILFVIFLLSIFSVMAVSSIWPGRKSATCDELAHHIPVGYVLLDKGDYKMDPSQPPLSRYIVALPLKLFMNLYLPDQSSAWRRADRSKFGKDFFYKYNKKPDKILFFSRSAVILIGILCGVFLFIWTRSLFGIPVAFFSLILYCFSPNILAHSRLATTDMTATCFIFLAVAMFWYFVRSFSFWNMLLAGITLGLALLSKYTAVFLYPIFIILMIPELVENKGSGKGPSMIFMLFGMFIISIIIAWAGYGFDSQPILHGAMRVDEKIGIAHSMIKHVYPSISAEGLLRLDRCLLEMPMPLGTFILGILGVMRHGYEGHGTFFLGEYGVHGNPLYFVVATAIKTPISMIIMFFLGLFLSFKMGIKRNERFLLVPICVFFVIASMSKLQLGLRYILPIYPFAFIVAAKGVIFLIKRKLGAIIIGLLVIWYIMSSLLIWPDYLSYFNEAIGGPKNGYKYLRDSNIDWGQDLPSLARYIKKNNIGKIKLKYFGTADPEYYGIEYETFDTDEVPGNFVYAISAHVLPDEWGKKYSPTESAGKSILIYDFRNSFSKSSAR